ncbi:hypothetical protein QUF74_12235 [Candidatus Halobeggiatoa sp. HSG11]|nr:hypothetical protein [Candidatus Halobeggiatoa sp. HSG11]
MLSNVKEHFGEFVVVCIILSGVLYSATTSYTTSVKVEQIAKTVEDNDKRTKEIAKHIATLKLKNGTLTDEDIRALMSSSEFQEFKLKMYAMEKPKKQLGSE